jgi:translation initiation factor IF-2
MAAGVPIVFAFTKVDKPGSNADRIREQLSAMNILVEDWGGKYQAQEISAKTGENVDLLLEKVLLEAELLDLKANPDKKLFDVDSEGTSFIKTPDDEANNLLKSMNEIISGLSNDKIDVEIGHNYMSGLAENAKATLFGYELDPMDPSVITNMYKRIIDSAFDKKAEADSKIEYEKLSDKEARNELKFKVNTKSEVVQKSMSSLNEIIESMNKVSKARLAKNKLDTNTNKAVFDTISSIMQLEKCD